MYIEYITGLRAVRSVFRLLHFADYSPMLDDRSSCRQFYLSVFLFGLCHVPDSICASFSCVTVYCAVNVAVTPSCNKNECYHDLEDSFRGPICPHLYHMVWRNSVKKELCFFYLLLTDLPKAVTLNKLRDEESRDKIPLSWSRVDRASTYRVYKRIKNEDGEWNDWERIRTTADDSYEITVERKKTYQFKVIGVNTNGDEGEGEIRTVKVLGAIIKDIIK